MVATETRGWGFRSVRVVMGTLAFACPGFVIACAPNRPPSGRPLHGVQLRWMRSAGPVDGYSIWRCSGDAASCASLGTPGAEAQPGWEEVGRVSAAEACAVTPCSGVVPASAFTPVSYFVVARQGAATSTRSNVMTLDQAATVGHAQR